MGTAGSKGTKVFALSGKVSRTGLVEVAMGTTVRQIVFDVGGGIPDGKAYKAVQIGGPSGGCIPASHLDIEIDYESLKTVGAMMGSGGSGRHGRGHVHGGRGQVLHGLHPARELRQVHPLPRGHAAHARGPRGHHARAQEREGCGRPASASRASWPSTTRRRHQGHQPLRPRSVRAEPGALSTLRWFRDEYEAHVYERRCPAGVCTELLTYTIDAEACRGCTLCLRKCPTGAILGAAKSPHYVIQDKCIACGTCLTVCRTHAVLVS